MSSVTTIPPDTLNLINSFAKTNNISADWLQWVYKKMLPYGLSQQTVRKYAPSISLSASALGVPIESAVIINMFQTIKPSLSNTSQKIPTVIPPATPIYSNTQLKKKIDTYQANKAAQIARRPPVLYPFTLIVYFFIFIYFLCAHFAYKKIANLSNQSIVFTYTTKEGESKKLTEAMDRFITIGIWCMSGFLLFFLIYSSIKHGEAKLYRMTTSVNSQLNDLSGGYLKPLMQYGTNYMNTGVTSFQTGINTFNKFAVKANTFSKFAVKANPEIQFGIAVLDLFFLVPLALYIWAIIQFCGMQYGYQQIHKNLNMQTPTPSSVAINDLNGVFWYISLVVLVAFLLVGICFIAFIFRLGLMHIPILSV